MIYPGGKNGSGIFQRIINLMPPHDRYIEAFLGSGAILRMKRPARENIGVDMDRAALDAFPSRPRPGGLTVEGVTLHEASALAPAPVWHYSGPETLIYCDPPYVHSTRSGGDLYRFEMSDSQHEELLSRALASTCRVMISGYRCALYDDALCSWNSVDYMAQTRGRPKQETLWFNFPEPTELHDYSFLGVGYRERERIKRKKLRWIERLRRMDRLERQAILAAIREGIEI